MATELQIYNDALVRVSAEIMDDVNEDTPQGLACRAILPTALETLLGVAAWPWAIKRVSIQVSLVSDAQLYPEFEQRYALPSDFVKLIGFVGTSPPNSKAIEGEYLLTDQGPPAVIKYVHRPSMADLTLIRGPFLECLVLKLAAELASKLQRDEPMARRILVQLAQAMRMALGAITDFVDLPGPSVDTIAPLALTGTGQ